jgi:hypothetical protein
VIAVLRGAEADLHRSTLRDPAGRKLMARGLAILSDALGARLAAAEQGN